MATTFVQPTTKYPRPDLSNAGFIQNFRVQSNIGHLIAPPCYSEKKLDNFDQISAKTLNQLPTTQGSQGGGANSVEVQMTAGSYECLQDWIQYPILDSKRAERPNRDWDAFGAQLTCGIIAARREKIIADLVLNETNFPASGTTGITLSVPWDAAAATPAADLLPMILQIQVETGVPLEWIKLEISQYTHLKLSGVTDVFNKLKLDNSYFGALIPLNLLAQYFGVGEVVVGKAVYDANDGGIATASMTQLWNQDYAFLFASPPAAARSESLDVPQVARTFCWDNGELWAASLIKMMSSPDSGVNAIPIMIDQYRDDKLKADIIRADAWQVSKIINSTAGKLIKNTKT